MSLARTRPLAPARRQLLDDREVLFAGYRQQHPLEPAIQVKVQTRSDNPGPVQAVSSALQSLVGELNQFEDRFATQLMRVQKAPPGAGQTGAGPMDM